MGCCLSVYHNKKLQQSSLSTCSYFSFQDKTVNSKIVDVYDGDTCTASIWLNDNIYLFKIRLSHIDTPELKDKNDRLRSIRARNTLLQFVTQNKNTDVHKEYTKQEIRSFCELSKCIVQIKCGPFDKYGRLLGEIFHSSSSVSINQQFRDLGYANPYEGKTKQSF
jgi:endonuclease YncB( thermonuclease family)